MVGGIAFVIFIVSMILLVGHGISNNAKTYEINKRYNDEESTHNYNDDYQSKLLNADYSQLEDFYGTSVYDYALEHFGSEDLMCQRAAVYSIVKELLKDLGYDYRPQVDTWEKRMYNQKNGYYNLQPTDIFYGL